MNMPHVLNRDKKITPMKGEKLSGNTRRKALFFATKETRKKEKGKRKI